MEPIDRFHWDSRGAASVAANPGCQNHKAQSSFTAWIYRSVLGEIGGSADVEVTRGKTRESELIPAAGSKNRSRRKTTTTVRL